MPSNNANTDFRPLMLRAKTLGRTLLQIYGAEGESTPPELVDLLDIAEQRLARAGYKVTSDLDASLVNEPTNREGLV